MDPQTLSEPEPLLRNREMTNKSVRISTTGIQTVDVSRSHESRQTTGSDDRFRVKSLPERRLYCFVGDGKQPNPGKGSL